MQTPGPPSSVRAEHGRGDIRSREMCRHWRGKYLIFLTERVDWIEVCSDAPAGPGHDVGAGVIQAPCAWYVALGAYGAYLGRNIVACYNPLSRVGS